MTKQENFDAIRVKLEKVIGILDKITPGQIEKSCRSNFYVIHQDLQNIQKNLMSIKNIKGEDR